jgi:hypothetical protein
VFTVGFLVAVVGVAVFVLFVQGAPALAAGPSETDGTDGTTAAGGDGALTPPAPSALTRLRRRAGHALANRRFRLVLVAGGSLALVRPGDALLYLSYQREAAVNVALFPLLFSGASVVFLLAAAPLGIVADRIGRLRVYLIGEAAVAGSLAVLATGIREPAALVVLLFLVGLSYAATDAVLAAMASEALGERWRTTGLAVLAAVVAAGRFVASTGFGALWERYGGTVAARVYLVGAVVVLVLGFLLLRVERADESRDGPDGHDGPNGQDGSDRDRKADVLEAMA